MQVFLFSSFNVLNAEKKLSALNQQNKCLLLLKNEEYKQQFLLSGNEEFTTISFSKENGYNATMKIL